MDAYFTHALVLSDFERFLPAQTYEELLNEDYPLHVIYNTTTGEEIFQSSPIDSNPLEVIGLIQSAFSSCGIAVHWEHKVFSEKEYQRAKSK